MQFIVSIFFVFLFYIFITTLAVLLSQQTQRVPNVPVWFPFDFFWEPNKNVLGMFPVGYF